MNMNNTATVNAFAHLTATSTPKTLDEAIYIGKLKDTALQAALAAKSTALKGLSLGISEFGKGTITIKGIGRFGVSLYPSQAMALDEYVKSGALLTFINDPSNVNKLRCAAFATEYAVKSGCKWEEGKSKTDASTVAYQKAYQTGYAMAAASPDLVASPR